MFFLSLCKDDTVLLTQTEKELLHNFGEFNKAVKKHRLAMSEENTTTTVGSMLSVMFEIEEQRLTNVREQVYLGWLCVRTTKWNVS